MVDFACLAGRTYLSPTAPVFPDNKPLITDDF